MKHSFRLLLLLIALFFVLSCGKNTPLTPPVTSPISFGTENTLDIITWNLKLFPQNTNLDALKQMIVAMSPDVIAFQEIMDYNAFMDMASDIPHYLPLVYEATPDYRLGYLYDSRTVNMVNQYTIFNNDSNPFPRPPYVLDFLWQGTEYYVINNHLKAYGDNYIDETDSYDEEVRRRLACQMLDNYISTNLPNGKVVVVGDMNDQIAEPREYNVFLSFLDKPEEYLFGDMPIALAPTYNTVSYPSSMSHIDHILISNELFDDFTAASSYCKAIRAENWMLNWTEYAASISDHRPVGIRLAQSAR
jgi:endonuclease/exonuclease/phosphatase family metal-dependent hydrolase